MVVAYAVLAVLLSAMLGMSARGKLVGDPRVVEGLTNAGTPRAWYPYLAACEIAGALGLLAGLFVRPSGIAAAVGIVLYFVGAVGFHLRAGDVKGLPPAAVILVAAVAALTLRTLAG